MKKLSALQLSKAVTLSLSVVASSGCVSTKTQPNTSQNFVIIKNGAGGQVNQTFAKYRGWNQSGKKVIIDGNVQSADAFAAFSMPNTCYTPRAVFSPHAASTLGLIPNYAATERLTAGLPPVLAARFRDSGAFYNWVTTAKIDYAELKRVWPEGECGPGGVRVNEAKPWQLALK